MTWKYLPAWGCLLLGIVFSAGSDNGVWFIVGLVATLFHLFIIYTAETTQPMDDSPNPEVREAGQRLIDSLRADEERG